VIFNINVSYAKQKICEVCNYLDDNRNYIDNSASAIYEALRADYFEFEMPTIDSSDRYYMIKNDIVVM
jgi:hypothetical protein